MIVKAVNENPVAADRRPQLPVPVETAAQAGKSRDGRRERPARLFAAGGRRSPRPSAAFLAQLCLQYDDAARQRQARLERTERAARIYDAASERSPAAPQGRQANFRI